MTVSPSQWEIRRWKPRDPAVFPLQGYAYGHPVLHPNHAARGPGPHHHGGGLQVLTTRPAEDLLLDQRDLLGPECHHLRIHPDQFPGRHPQYRKHPRPAHPPVSGMLWGERGRSRVCGAAASCIASLGTSSLRVPGPAPSLGTEHKGAATAGTGTGQFQWEKFCSAKALQPPCRSCPVTGYSMAVVGQSPCIKCHLLCATH